MSKTIQEQIEVMQHFTNGGEVEYYENKKWFKVSVPTWDWYNYDYRIKEQKKTITIEKWLCIFYDGEYRVVDSSDISLTNVDRVKLLETYEVEL